MNIEKHQKELKAKLLEMLFNKEITKEQFKEVLRIGLIRPVDFEIIDSNEANTHEVKNNSLDWIYERLGQNIKAITFKVIQ